MQPNYEKMVEMVGGYSERVTDPADVRPAVDRALAAGTIALVNVITDPEARRAGTSYLG
jgi:acetolactate synthase-1/2/3 large subunit